MSEAAAAAPAGAPEEKKTEEKPGFIARAVSYWPWFVGGVTVLVGGYATYRYFTDPSEDELDG